MAQLFTRRATVRLRAGLIILVVALASVAASLFAYSRTDLAWQVGVAAPQPIPFRHDLHAGSLQIDCRFCHATAGRSARAGTPSAETCLGCHREIWAGASLLEPLRTAAALGLEVPWRSVHRLPAHAAFHHGAHVATGMACRDCHGAVEAMAETVKTQPLSMGWCLACHRKAEESSRGLGRLGRLGLPAGHARGTDGRLADCSTCHR